MQLLLQDDNSDQLVAMLIDAGADINPNDGFDVRTLDARYDVRTLDARYDVRTLDARYDVRTLDARYVYVH